DVEGREAWHKRVQKNVGDVITTSRYDALGRLEGTTTTGARVNDLITDLDTRTEYNLAARTITDFDAHRSGEFAAAPRTVKTLDNLGRVVETLRTAPSGPTVKAESLYDIHGQLAYTTDRKRSAAITQHDPFGRAVATLLGDGTRSHVAYDEWDEVL